ncbi:MAG TPA: hypothetical protein PKC18_09075 [Lacipirellulaceae bacterium]|nr:hypothetical protein [Lacipirellulaceae bacterium]
MRDNRCWDVARLRRWTVAAAVAIIAAAGALPGTAWAQAPAENAPAEDDGDSGQSAVAALLRIKLPLAPGSDASLRQSIVRLRDRLVERSRQAGDARRPVLVLELAPHVAADNGGAGSAFEPAYALATLLTSREMNQVQSVAWIPQSIRGHGVLVALACDEIVAPADVEFGEAGVDESADAGGPRDAVVTAYREIARLSGRIPESVAQSMVDSSVELIQVESEAGVRLLLRSELDDFRDDHDILSEKSITPAGSLTRLTGRMGFEYGVVRRPAADRAALAEGLGIPLDALREDQSLLADWVPFMLEIKGPVTPRTVSQLKTLLGRRLASGANWVGVRIDSVGGDVAACLELAETLAALDPNAVRTVAYVPVEARGGAAIIALSCQQLAMHNTATVGAGPQPGRAAAPPAVDPRALPPLDPRLRRPGGPEPPADDAVDLANVVTSLRASLAGKTEHSWSLLAAMLDGSIEIAVYRNKATGQTRLMSAGEATALPDAVNWTRGAAVGGANEPLSLTGVQAASLGLATTVDNFDHLRRLYGIEDVETVRPDWALTLVQALASPGLATFLVFLGLVGLYIEIKTPGVGIGGVVAAIAFLLFFWSKYLEGTAESLEILMFVAGVVLMLIEVFVVPGVGIFGLSGALLIIFSLVLASQTFILPRSQAQLDQLAQSIGTLVIAGLGFAALAIAARRYLPHAPLFNRMMLEPPPPEERITRSHREALADFTHLVGKTGVALTDLRPGGRVDVDVLALDEPIDRGTAIVVVSAHANRVIVRKAT